jgi:cytochrome c oxidase subunit 2
VRVLFAILLLAGSLVGSSETNGIDVTAKRFSFSPDHITVKKGEPVVIHLTSQDVAHGLLIKELGVKADVPKGKEVDVKFTPTQAGTFVGKCAHFCGAGHGSMRFTVTVTE